MWRLLTERPGRYTVEEILRDLKLGSKAKLNRAMADLEDAGLIRIED